MTDLFTRRRDIASCPLTKQNHLGKCSTGELRTSTLVNNAILRSIADFASALSNNLLAFLVIMLFSSLCSHPKIICGGVAYTSRKLQDYKNIYGGDPFLIT